MIESNPINMSPSIGMPLDWIESEIDFTTRVGVRAFAGWDEDLYKI